MVDDATTSPEREPATDADVDRLIVEGRDAWSAGRGAEAYETFRRGLELAERVLQPDDPHIATILIGLSRVVSARGRRDEAITLARRALAIHRARSDEDQPVTLDAMTELATTLFDAQAEDPEADALIQRAIEGYNALGRDDTDFASLIGTAGFRRFWVGRYAEAELQLHRALAMFERLLGPGAPATAEAAAMLGLLYDRRWNEIDPIPYYRKALAGYEASHDDDHPTTLDARYRLADALRRRGREEEAAPMLDRVIEALLSGRPEIDRDADLWFLGGCCEYLREAGRDAEVEAIQELAGEHHLVVAMWRKDAEEAARLFGGTSEEHAEALKNQAGHLAMLGRPEEAEAAAQRALEILRARLVRDDPATVEFAGQIGRFRATGEEVASEPRERRGLGRPDDSVFDPLTFPWADERRPDLIRAYLASASGEEGPSEAGLAITAMSFMTDSDVQWEMVLELTEGAPNDDALRHIGIGIMQGLFINDDADAIRRVEVEAPGNLELRRALTAVQRMNMSEDAWSRVRQIQSGVADPLG